MSQNKSETLKWGASSLLGVTMATGLLVYHQQDTDLASTDYKTYHSLLTLFLSQQFLQCGNFRIRLDSWALNHDSIGPLCEAKFVLILPSLATHQEINFTCNYTKLDS